MSLTYFPPQVSAEHPPEGAERSFAIVVERTVRTLPWPVERLARVRSELLAHLRGARDEALAAGESSANATQQAIARFGDPDAVALDLHATTTWSDRVSARLERLVGRCHGESTERFALRFAASVAGMIALGLALVAIEERRSAPEFGRLAFVTAAVVTGCIGLLATGTLYCGIKLANAWNASSRKTLRISVWLAALISVYPTCHAALARSSGASFAQMAGRLNDWTGGPWVALATGTMFVMAIGMIVGWTFERERQYRDAWANLPIEA